ncbi:hypothetical protein [Epibacterium sp. Ofav1-8]|uniref:hypothetical protein n=1 Tax=Epibacterium sp. Ofav1-8 TaxID=2917735 RepID=UPI001EF68D2D|nr:hypothetical protein [Epibacterium sp. Ofav1-8]MCG7622723.1 hypothetical protein [Epibacterium sp. Ofav1-8]
MTDTEFHVEGIQRPENGPSVDSEGQGAEHLTTFRASELDTEGGGADDVVPVDTETGEPLDALDEVEQITKDAFFVAFRHSFGLPGMFLPHWKPLAIHPEETEIARDASDAIYDLLQIYYPAALMPQSETLALLSRAAPFVIAKVMVVRMILEERRLAKMEAVNEPKGEAKGEFRSQRKAEAPANANTPPPANTNSPFAWADEGGQAA